MVWPSELVLYTFYDGIIHSTIHRPCPRMGMLLCTPESVVTTSAVYMVGERIGEVCNIGRGRKRVGEEKVRWSFFGTIQMVCGVFMCDGKRKRWYYFIPSASNGIPWPPWVLPMDYRCSLLVVSVLRIDIRRRRWSVLSSIIPIVPAAVGIGLSVSLHATSGDNPTSVHVGGVGRFGTRLATVVAGSRRGRG